MISKNRVPILLPVFLRSLVLLTLPIAVACNDDETKMGAHGQQVEDSADAVPPDPSISPSPEEGPREPARRNGQEESALGDQDEPAETFSILIPAASASVKGAVVQNRPLALVFAIDVTGSMAPSINAVKDNIAAFARTIAQRAFELSVGVVAFDDQIRSTFSLSRDVTAIRQFVGSLQAFGGVDVAEGSLLAIRSAVSMLGMQETRPEAIRAVMVITDTVGHDGDSLLARTCNELPLIQTLNSLDPASHGRLKFFFSVGQSIPFETAACVRDPRQQYANILKSIFPTVPQVERGGTVDFPFSGPAFIDQLPALLEKTIPAVRSVCGPQRAAVIAGDSVVRTWAAPDAQRALEIANTQKEFAPFTDVAAADLAAWEASSAVVEVDYICADQNGDPSVTSPEVKRITFPLDSLRKE